MGKQRWYWQQRMISTVWEGRPILRRVPGFDPCWCKRVHKVATEEVINDSLYRSIPKMRLFKIVSQQLKPYRSWLKIILELYIGSREVLENCTFLDGRGTTSLSSFSKVAKTWRYSGRLLIREPILPLLQITFSLDTRRTFTYSILGILWSF